MLRKILFVAAFFAYAFVCHAQTESVKPKMLNHYIGVQANQLFKQMINLNASNAAITNPYLLTYSVNSVKYGWGIQAGLGYNYQRIEDTESMAPHETKINELFYRVGIGRKFILSKKWEAGCGLDFVGDYQLNKTFTSSVVNLTFTMKDSTASISADKTKSSGYGAQFTLGFHISEKIIISTEATYYFIKSEAKQNVLLSETITDTAFPENDSQTLSSSNSGTKRSDFTFSIPVALFLIMKF